MEQLDLKLAQILETLEKVYGLPKIVGPTDPYEMIVYLNCGYPAADGACAKGFDALKRKVGVHPRKLLAASKTKLTKLMRLGGIVPEARAERLKEIAHKVKDEFGGALTITLKKRIREDGAGRAVKAAKKVLQEFPVIGEPSAEKIVLFAGLAPVAAVPSAFVDVPIRLFVGEPGKNYAADYRAARDILDAGLPKTFEARQRAYLLLKRHGQETCKRSKPRCEICPIAAQCAYIQAKAADGNAE